MIRTLVVQARTVQVFLFVFSLTILIALAAGAQQSNSSGMPARPLATEEAAAALVNSQRPAPETWQTLLARRSRTKTATSPAPDLEAASFLPQVLYGSGAENPDSIVIADVNGDGKLDLVISNCDPSGSGGCGYVRNGVIGVLLGNGDGTFQPAVAYDSGGNLAYSVAVADLNGDGKPDLIVTHFCADVHCTKKAGVSVLLGNGNGTFQKAVTYNSGGQESLSVAVADVNTDGKLDLLITNTCPDTCGTHGVVSVLLGNGDGTFQPPVSYDSGGIGPRSIVALDINGDGKIDVLVANSGVIDGYFPSVGSLAVLLGNGDGTFQAPVSYSAGQNPWSLAVADVNGDGLLDALLADSCWCGHNAALGVLLGNGDGTFKPVATYDSGNQDTFAVAVADVNGDGKPDLLAGSLGTSALSLLLGNGDGTFQSPVTFNTGNTLNSIAAVDLNGDGKPDIVASTEPGYVGILLNNTTSSSVQTTTALVSSLNPSNSGKTVTFTAGVSSSSGTPSGTVIFYNGSTILGRTTLADGSASLSISSLSARTHSIVAAYQGSSGFAFSASAALHQIVHGTTTTTSLASSLSSTAFGQTVTFTATVSSSATTPFGTVIFYDGSAALGQATLSGGSAAISVSSLAAGSRSITAAYQGSGSYKPSTSPVLKHTVSAVSSATSLAPSTNPGRPAETITYTAIVTSQNGGSATGSVVFQDRGATVATVSVTPVNNNLVTFSTLYRTAGDHSITATYSGDPDNTGSASATLTESIDNVSHTRLTTSGSPSFIENPVTFTAAVTSKSGPIPDGDLVTFYNGPTAIGTGKTAGGVATFTTSSLTPAPHAIKAIYAGDATFLPSTGSLTQVVSLYPSTTTLSSNRNPSPHGQIVTFTVTVGSSAPNIPTGVITFKDGTVGIGTAALTGGVATFSTSRLAVGTHSITALYGGDGQSAKSVSLVLTQIVQ